MRLTAALLVLSCALAVASVASAKPLRLASTKLTYQDRSTFHEEVREAVRMWNTAGTPVRLRPAARGRAADIRFVTRPKLVDHGNVVAGLGGIHFTRQRKPYGMVQLSASELGSLDPSDPQRTDIVAHELGHALGLPHTRTDCTLMFPTNRFIRGVCPSPPDSYLCGPQRADAAALARLYSGRLRFPANGGLCRLPAGAAEFVEPGDEVTITGGWLTAAVRNTGVRVWTQDSVALTISDACGAAMQAAPDEPSVAPGEVAHFGTMVCGASGETRVLSLQMLDEQTQTMFGPVRAITAHFA